MTLPAALKKAREKAIQSIWIKSISSSLTATTSIMALLQSTERFKDSEGFEMSLGFFYCFSLVADATYAYTKLIELRKERIAANDRQHSKLEKLDECCSASGAYITGISLGLLCGSVGFFAKNLSEATRSILKGVGTIVSDVFVSTNTDKIDKEIENLKDVPAIRYI